jgi:hypothetical protein
MCPRLKEKDLPASFLALKEGKDDPVLKSLRAHRFVVANDQECGTMRQIAHELKMF